MNKYFFLCMVDITAHRSKTDAETFLAIFSTQYSLLSNVLQLNEINFTTKNTHQALSTAQSFFSILPYTFAGKVPCTLNLYRHV